MKSLIIAFLILAGLTAQAGQPSLPSESANGFKQDYALGTEQGYRAGRYGVSGTGHWQLVSTAQRAAFFRAYNQGLADAQRGTTKTDVEPPMYFKTDYSKENTCFYLTQLLTRQARNITNAPTIRATIVPQTSTTLTNGLHIVF